MVVFNECHRDGERYFLQRMFRIESDWLKQISKVRAKQRMECMRGDTGYQWRKESSTVQIVTSVFSLMCARCPSTKASNLTHLAIAIERPRTFPRKRPRERRWNGRGN
jgi:hypothetical protein